jgi:hypothetical protein
MCHVPSESIIGSMLPRYFRFLWLFLILLGGSLGCANLPTTLLEPAPFSNASAPLVTPTYDGSGQAIHPGIVYVPIGWHGFSYWMAVTPYPNYDFTVENPSVLASNDGIDWQVPPGLRNPVTSGTGELADPDLFYDATSDQLWMYYIRKIYPTVYLVRRVSSDGVNWSDPQDVVTMPKNALLSPAVDKVGKTYYLWYVNAWPDGSSASSSTMEYRTSQDGIHWSEANVCQIDQPGYVIWHIDVLAVLVRNPDSGVYEEKEWLLAAAYPMGMTSGWTKLFFAESGDAVNWATYSQPVLNPGKVWDAGQIYRSTLLYDPLDDLIKVWYSARSAGEASPTVYQWHTGYTRQSYAILRARLALSH